MAERVSNSGDDKDLRNLFGECNRRYFGDRLPRYKVLLTNNHSRWEGQKRRIYVNPNGGYVSVILLHEMVHASVGPGHSEKLRDEIRRPIELGAPMHEELQRYSPGNEVSEEQLLSEYFEAGLYQANEMSLAEARKWLRYKYGLTELNGRAISLHWSHFLRKARREWIRGRAIALG